MFRSVDNTTNIDNRAPEKLLFFNFSLCISHDFRILPSPPGLFATQTITASFASAKEPETVSTSSRSTLQLSFELENLTDDAFKNMDPTIMVNLFADSRLVTTIHTGVTTLISGLTRKIDHVRFVTSLTFETIFMELLDLFDLQSSFDTIFGSCPIIICLSK